MLCPQNSPDSSAVIKPDIYYPDADACILVPSWDGYRDVWAPFFHSFFKYWPDCPYPIYLGANKMVFNDPRVQMLTVAENTNYSSSLIAFLNQLSQQWIIVWGDDLLLKKYVNNVKFHHVIGWAKKNNVGHLRLWADRHALVSVFASKNPIHEIPDFGNIQKGSKYRAGLTIGLWKKEILLSLLRSGESAWDFELGASLRSVDIDNPFISITSWGAHDQLMVVNSIRKGLWTIEGVNHIRDEGMSWALGKRAIEQKYKYILITSIKMPLRKLLFMTMQRIKNL